METPEVYELINPSDAVCFETADEEALCMGVLFLGNGLYGLRCGERDVLGLVAFSPADSEEAAKRLDSFMAQPDAKKRIAATLRTAIYCKPGEWRALSAAFATLAPEDRVKAVAKFNDERRSSLNDISRACE